MIELLVVISVIGILSSFVVTSLNSARAKARDALRKADMSQLRTALDLYYDDHARYPICNHWENDSPFGATADAIGSGCYTGQLKSALTSGLRPYLAGMPKDPSNELNDSDLNVFFYRYVSDIYGSKYALAYRLESDPTIDQIIRGF